MAEAKRYNEHPILLTEGIVYLDGVQIYDGVTLKITAHLKNWNGTTIGSRGRQSSRITGCTYDGQMTRRRKTPWARKTLQEYLKNGKTPEFTVQGVQADKDSDYYQDYGSETVTAVGCVLKGDITLIEMDAEGDVLNDVLDFDIYDVNFN